MMKQEPKTWRITGLMGLTVFLVFALSILGVLLTGAESYRRLAEGEQRSYEARTAAQYITTRVRQGDREDGLTVADFQGCDALILREQIGGDWYLTRIYCYDGWLRELFTGENREFSPEAGEKILSLTAMQVTASSETVQVTLELPDGTRQTLTLYLRSGREVPA